MLASPHPDHPVEGAQPGERRRGPGVGEADGGRQGKRPHPDHRPVGDLQIVALGQRLGHDAQRDLLILAPHRDPQRRPGPVADQVPQILEGLHGLAVDAQDVVSGEQPPPRGRRIGRDHAHHRRDGLVAGKDRDAEEDEDRQDQVHPRPGEGDQAPLPGGGLQKGAALVLGGDLLGGVVAGHLHVAAERQERDAVVGVARLEAEQARAKAEGEAHDLDPAELGHREVAELVDEDQRPHEQEEGGCTTAERPSSRVPWERIQKTTVGRTAGQGACHLAQTSQAAAFTRRALRR